MRIVVLSRDLIIASRILAQASAAGLAADLVADPDALPPAESVSRLFVNWADRGPGWGVALAAWRAEAPESAAPRVTLFGPHADLDAHADARAAGLGPMWARSKLVSSLPDLVSD